MLSIEQKPLVKHVTEEDLDKYTIFDVVLPQPGTKILYPNNEVLDVYKSIMSKCHFGLLAMYHHKTNIKSRA
jgi:tRNA pseudouridine13 synthase